MAGASTRLASHIVTVNHEPLGITEGAPLGNVMLPDTLRVAVVGWPDIRVARKHNRRRENTETRIVLIMMIEILGFLIRFIS